MAENEVKKVSRIKKAGQNLARQFREVKAELKKVIWPNRTQLINNTVTVLIFCLIVGIIIWAADFGLTALADIVFAK